MFPPCLQMFDNIRNRTPGFLFQTEEDERLDMPELSKEEKEAKKNTRPKTRFGRVSKPPKHMVKVRISNETGYIIVRNYSLKNCLKYLSANLIWG